VGVLAAIVEESGGVEPLAFILLAVLLALDPFSHHFGRFYELRCLEISDL
jgi:hypothetical protein